MMVVFTKKSTLIWERGAMLKVDSVFTHNCMGEQHEFFAIKSLSSYSTACPKCKGVFVGKFHNHHFWVPAAEPSNN